MLLLFHIGFEFLVFYTRTTHLNFATSLTLYTAKYLKLKVELILFKKGPKYTLNKFKLNILTLN